MIDLAHKDLGIALDVANQLHVPMPLGAASREVITRHAPLAVAGKTGPQYSSRFGHLPD